MFTFRKQNEAIAITTLHVIQLLLVYNFMFILFFFVFFFRLVVREIRQTVPYNPQVVSRVLLSPLIMMFGFLKK